MRGNKTSFIETPIRLAQQINIKSDKGGNTSSL